MTDPTAIHESKNSETIVKFIDSSELNKKAQKAIYNGEVVGFYYTPSGNIRYTDVWNQTHKAQ